MRGSVYALPAAAHRLIDFLNPDQLMMGYRLEVVRSGEERRCWRRCLWCLGCAAAGLQLIGASAWALDSPASA